MLIEEPPMAREVIIKEPPKAREVMIEEPPMTREVRLTHQEPTILRDIELSEMKYEF